MVETLSISVDRHTKGRPRKREKETIKKIGYPYFKLNLEIKKIEKIYNSFDPSQQEWIKIETENRLPNF